MKCPYRRVEEYHYEQIGDKVFVRKVEESYADCHEDACPLYDEYNVLSRCKRASSGVEES